MPSESRSGAAAQPSKASVIGVEESSILIADVPAGADRTALLQACQTDESVKQITFAPLAAPPEHPRTVVVLEFALPEAAAGFLSRPPLQLQNIKFPDVNKLFLCNLTAKVTAADIEAWLPEKLVRRPGIVPPQEDSDVLTSCSLMFFDPDAAARAIVHATKVQPQWALPESPLRFSFKDPDLPEETPKPVVTVSETKNNRHKGARRRSSTTDEAKDTKISKGRKGQQQYEEQPRRSSMPTTSRRESASSTKAAPFPAKADDVLLARQSQLLDSLSDVMKSLSTNDRKGKRTEEDRQEWAKGASSSSRLMSAAATLIDVGQVNPPIDVQSASFLGTMSSSPTSASVSADVWKPPVAHYLPANTMPILSVESLADGVILSRSGTASQTRLLRLLDGTSGQGLWAGDSALAEAQAAIRSGDILQLGSVRLDLLLYHLTAPIVQGVEFVTFSPQPKDVIATLAVGDLGSAGGGDCFHGGRPVCLIVVPTSLNWFRQVRLVHGSRLRFNVDLDQALGEDAAWGMLIVERGV